MFTGEQIKKKRKALGWSAETLATHLKVKKDNVYKWEKGTRPIDPEEYRRVENWLSGNLENIPVESPEKDSDNPTLKSLARSLELSAEARLADSESRKLEADNVKRLIALLEMKIQGKAGLELPLKGTPGTRTYKPEEKGKGKAG